MFSRILHFFAAFLFSHKFPCDSELSLQIHQQIQTELERAARQGMVFTRSQGSTPARGTSQDVVLKKKMKAGGGGEDLPAHPATKRRRRSVRTSGDAVPASSANKPGRPRRRGSAKTINGHEVRVIDREQSDQESGQESGQESSSQGSQSNSPPVLGFTTDQTIDEDKEDKAIEVAIVKPSCTRDMSSEVLDAHDRVKLDAAGATRSRNGRTKGKRTKDSEGIASEGNSGAESSTIRNKPGSPFATAAQSTHKRFGSEDVEVAGTVSSSGIEGRKGGREDVSEDEVESGDEAPETVTASAGFDKARTSALGAAKVAARQKAEKKVKRREHGQRLALQAESAKDPRHNNRPSTIDPRPNGSSAKVAEVDDQIPVEGSEFAKESPDIMKDVDGKSTGKAKPSGKMPLPLLLPEEILGAQPEVHAPRLPVSRSKVAIGQKRKFLDMESKPRKDIKRGDVTICFLQDNRSILPPKSSPLSQTLRECWLMGRRGFKGESGVPRRKVSGGFVRRKGSR